MSRYKPYYKFLSIFRRVPWDWVKVDKLRKFGKKKWKPVVGPLRKRIRKIKYIGFRKRRALRCSGVAVRGGISRKFYKFLRIRTGKFNHKMFLWHRHFFLHWYGKRKTRVFQLKKLSRMIVKKSENQGVSRSEFFLRHLEFDPALHFFTYRCLKNLNDGNLLLKVKKIWLKKSYSSIGKLNSLDLQMFEVDPLLSGYFIRRFLAKRVGVTFRFYQIYRFLMKKFCILGFSSLVMNNRFYRPRGQYNLATVEARKKLSFGELVWSGNLHLKGLPTEFFFPFVDSLLVKEVNSSSLLSSTFVLEELGFSLGEKEIEKEVCRNHLELDFTRSSASFLGSSSLGEESVSECSSKRKMFRNLRKKKKAIRGKAETYLGAFLAFSCAKKKTDLSKESFEEVGLKNSLGFSLLKKETLYTKEKKGPFQQINEIGGFKSFLSKNLDQEKVKRKGFKKHRLLKRSKYKLNYPFPLHFEVNYKLLRVCYLGKFSGVQGSPRDYFPIDLGSLCTRLAY